MSTITNEMIEKFVDTRVRLVYTPDGGGDAVEIIASIEAFNADAGVLMPREKGKTLGFLLELKNVIEIEASVEPIKILKQKILKPVDVTNVRQHLADRHGYLLTHLNKVTDEVALADHDQIDHDFLGHSHQDASPGSEDADSDS